MNSAAGSNGQRPVGSNGQRPARQEFPVRWRGYDRDQVDEHVNAMAEAVRLLTAERDATAEYAQRRDAEIAKLRVSYEKVRDRLDRVCRTPVECDGLSERLLRMVELAESEAAEIRAEAEGIARRRRAELAEAEQRMLRERERGRAELDARRARWEAEARAAEEQAQHRRREQDEQALRRRQELERDFARNLAARRDEANRAIVARDTAARAEADRVLTEAAERADEIVARAGQRIRTLEEARRRVAVELRSVRQLLGDALPLTDPAADEAATGPGADELTRTDAFAARAADGACSENGPDGVDGPDGVTGPGGQDGPDDAAVPGRAAHGSADVEAALPVPRNAGTTVSTGG